MINEEIWKDVVGYEGLYQVSNLGRVKSVKHLKERILRTPCNNMGYYYVDLYSSGVKKRFLVHRLVAFSFLKKIDGKEYIDHIDGNPKNNSIDNLRWCTHIENCNFEIALKRKRAVQKEIHSREDWRHKKSIATQKQMNNPRNKENFSRKIREKWKDPLFLKNQRERECMNRKVMQYTLEKNFVKDYISINSAHRETGVHSASIGRCCMGKQKTAGGFIWKYKE